MNRILLLALVIAWMSGCKKGSDREPEPELSTRVAGTYKASKLTYGGVDLPLDGISNEMLIVLEKAGVETVTGRLSLKVAGESAPEVSMGTMILKEAGDSGVDIYEGTVKIVNITKSSQLSFAGEDDGVLIEVVAQKQ